MSLGLGIRQGLAVLLLPTLSLGCGPNRPQGQSRQGHLPTLPRLSICFWATCVFYQIQRERTASPLGDNPCRHHLLIKRSGRTPSPPPHDGRARMKHKSPLGLLDYSPFCSWHQTHSSHPKCRCEWDLTAAVWGLTSPLKWHRFPAGWSRTRPLCHSTAASGSPRWPP